MPAKIDARKGEKEAAAEIELQRCKILGEALNLIAWIQHRPGGEWHHGEYYVTVRVGLLDTLAHKIRAALPQRDEPLKPPKPGHPRPAAP